MAITMYALVRVSDNSKVTEAQETTHLNNGTEAWVPIVYEDKPENLPQGKTAEKVEGLDGAVWRKSWTIRNKTTTEEKAERMEKLRKDERGKKDQVLDVLYAILDDDADSKARHKADIKALIDRRE